MPQRTFSKAQSSRPFKETRPGGIQRSSPSASRNATPSLPARNGKVFPIVGIGASAGGLEAFVRLLKVLPGQTGMGFVFIQHLDPKHHSLLSQLIGRATQIPVKEARNGQIIRP